MAGTIFEKSSTALRTWFYAMYLMSATRCGISAKQIQRETGVTYKTAWRMFKQIRTLMSEDVCLEGEAVEMDETYMGGKAARGNAVARPLTMARKRALSALLNAAARDRHAFDRCQPQDAPRHRQGIRPAGFHRLHR